MTGTGQVSIASNMSAIAIASCSLPSTSSAIAARIQAMSAPAQNDGPVAGEDDGPELRRRLARERRERRPQLGDERRVERVVDLRPGQRDAGDDAARAGPLEPEELAHPGIVAGARHPRSASALSTNRSEFRGIPSPEAMSSGLSVRSSRKSSATRRSQYG